MCAMKTPGVYIVEKNAFPNSVVEVATAVPAFIGYTQKAINGTNSLSSVPWKINSLSEYELYFGTGPEFVFKFDFTAADVKSFISVDAVKALDSAKNSTVPTKLAADITVWTSTDAALAKATEDGEKKALTIANQEAKDAAVASAKEYLQVVNSLTQFLSGAGLDKTKYVDIGNKTATLTKGLEKIEAKDAAYTVATLKTDTEALAATVTAFKLPDDVTVRYYNVNRSDKFNLYQNLKFFFANGGGSCYIVSVGDYSSELDRDILIKAIDTLSKEQEPTMVIVPEAVNLTKDECYDLQNAVAAHCGQMKNRITIMDVHDGYKDRKDSSGDVIAAFREKITTPFSSYASAYYPWLNTSIVSEKEVSFLNIATDNLERFKTVLKLYHPYLGNYIDKISSDAETTDLNTIHKVLYNQSALYSSIIKEMLRQLNLMPTASAMAGIYSLVDHTKEVWKAPANIGLANVISPAVNISHMEQDDLNVPLDGKAVNAIRYFVGQGVKVWGARTLDGNSLDWRYINVRRTMIMLEESIGIATKAFVFDPNTTNTWVSVRSMISNFLNGIWKRGGLAGAVPEDAFSVHIGLGETMTPEDILEGIMRITVLVAVVRPAEFIEITFQQQMQKS